MQLRPPGIIATVAAGQDLGQRVATYRSWRTDLVRAAWIAGVVAVVPAVGSVLIGLPVVGLLLVPLAVLGAAAYAALLRPVGGRRWQVVYERGLVDVIDNGPPLLARWEWVEGRVRPGPAGGHAILVHPVGAVAPIWVVLTGLEPLADLVETVDLHVEPVIVARHLTALEAGERVEFGPLAVTADTVERVNDGDRLPWESVESVRLVSGDRIVINRSGELRAWFSGQLPDASVAAGTIAGLRPQGDADQPGTTVLVPAPAPHTERLRNRRRRYLAPLAGLVVLALLPGVGYAAIDDPDDRSRTTATRTTPPAVPTRSPVRPSPTPSRVPPPLPPLPETIYGFSPVCEGKGFSGAARYGGPGPHPIYVAENFLQGPANWYSEDPAKIQLVACVELRKGRVLKSCRYYGDGKRVVQDMLLGRYTLVFREARTAKVIGQARIDGAKADCLLLLFGRQTSDEQVSVPTAAQIRNALRRYVE